MNGKELKAPNTKSPFKEQALLEKEITEFINKYKSTVVLHSKRISDYFEMCCFNYIVRYYERKKYTVHISNTFSTVYKYKCSPAGLHSNFSHFEVSKIYNGELHEFEIHHNLALQSGHSPELFTVSDISVVKKASIEIKVGYYENKKRLSYSLNENLITFFEVKQMHPFPELVFNFIGIVNELRPSILANTAISHEPQHLAPSLMISGKPTKPVKNIKLELEKRYCINIIFDLFYSGTKTFSGTSIHDLKSTGKLIEHIFIEEDVVGLSSVLDIVTAEKDMPF